jgi:hypothetical protein
VLIPHMLLICMYYRLMAMSRMDLTPVHPVPVLGSHGFSTTTHGKPKQVRPASTEHLYLWQSCHPLAHAHTSRVHSPDEYPGACLRVTSLPPPPPHTAFRLRVAARLDSR